MESYFPDTVFKFVCTNCHKKRQTTIKVRAEKGVCMKCRLGLLPVKGQIDVFGNVTE